MSEFLCSIKEDLRPSVSYNCLIHHLSLLNLMLRYWAIKIKALIVVDLSQGLLQTLWYVHSDHVKIKTTY